MTQSNYNNENEEDERMDEYDYIPISCIDDSENNLYLERDMIIRYLVDLAIVLSLQILSRIVLNVC